jgi:uncharacterized membrane protein
VRGAYQRTLSARGRDAPHLLRSRLLRGSLQKRRPASRKSDEGVMILLGPISRAFGSNRRTLIIVANRASIYLLVQ